MLAGALDLFARHLDLKPLRGRRRGCVCCIFHREKTPSLSVDLDRGLFNCFACGAQGGIRRFRELVGEAAPRPLLREIRRESEAERGRREVLDAEARCARERAQWAPFISLSQYLRRSHQVVSRARAVATATGESPRIWTLLALAARVECDSLNVEAELDSILMGRVA
jgi:hypothetical protein